MEEKNEFIWNDENLIKPRCLKCFIPFPQITKPKYDINNAIKYKVHCDYCRYTEDVDLQEYLKFIKSNNIQIPLCSECSQNPSTYIKFHEFTYFCDNCINQNKIRDYKKLKNNFNSYYCKKHNKSFKFINSGEPYCEICFSNFKELHNYGPLCHSYSILYYKVKKNFENFKEDKIYIENLISDIKNKYPESEEKKVKINEGIDNEDEDESEFTFFRF